MTSCRILRPFQYFSSVGLVFTNRNMHAVLSLVLRSLSWLPSTIAEQLLILQFEDLNFQRSTALDHFLLAVIAESP